jgi:predicted N-acetyltransferase YhbS
VLIAPAFIPELDFVAELDQQIVGNIMYSKAKVAAANGVEHEVISFGPISVSPSHQKEGIGAMLINHTKNWLKKWAIRLSLFSEIRPIIIALAL